MALLRQLPAFVLLILGAAGLMLVPALHAAQLQDWPVARGFLYHALFFMLFGVILGLATMNRQPRNPARYHLLTLLLAYALLPLVLAAPLVALVPGIGARRRLLRDAVLPHDHRGDAVRPAAARCPSRCTCGARWSAGWAG